MENPTTLPITINPSHEPDVLRTSALSHAIALAELPRAVKPVKNLIAIAEQWRDVAPWEVWELEPYAVDPRTTDTEVRALIASFRRDGR